ncbi:MAG: UDP-N-acetylmuramoyl-tripeptide--D-alanyl-D-alanine ligase [Oligoflexales bacterium]|nr:UDP-N-acetylmuramoyl-tripeptide--D-alanyl-D-alanine ligase [Oligoflexales bacterium]
MSTWQDYKKWLKPLLIEEQKESELDYKSSHKIPPPRPSNIYLDSRSIGPGQWFLPLRGKNHDAHQFIEMAIGRGAAGYFTQTPKDQLALSDFGKTIPYIHVRDTLEALQAIAKGYRKTFSQLKLAALTGSVGKTTTKEMLGCILEEAGPTLPFLAHSNNEVGVPKAILNLNSNHLYAIIELGARHQGDIALLTELIDPDVCACLNVGSAHIEIFGKKENTYKAKQEIFSHSRRNCVKVAPISDPLLLASSQEYSEHSMSFGFSAQATVYLQEVFWRYDGGMDLRVRIEGQEQTFSLPFAHEAYPLNLGAACAIAHAMKIPLDTMKKGLSRFQGAQGRYKIFHKGNLTFIDDSYNASPESMKTGLQTLVRSFGQKQKILVLGDMRELGELSNVAHKELGKLCYELVKPSLLITVGEQTRLTAQEAVSSGLAKDKTMHFANVDELCRAEIQFDRFGEIIYAKGSRSMALDMFISQMVSTQN